MLRYLNEAELMETSMRLCTFDDHDLLDCIPHAHRFPWPSCPALARAAFNDAATHRGQSPAQTAQVIQPQGALAQPPLNTASLSCEKAPPVRRGFCPCCLV